MKKEEIKEIKNKMLSDEQVNAVTDAIIQSMIDSFISVGTYPNEEIVIAAKKITDRVIHDAQASLMEKNVYKKVVANSKPLKVAKKKNARK